MKQLFLDVKMSVCVWEFVATQIHTHHIPRVLFTLHFFRISDQQFNYNLKSYETSYDSFSSHSIGYLTLGSRHTPFLFFFFHFVLFSLLALLLLFSQLTSVVIVAFVFICYIHFLCAKMMDASLKKKRKKGNSNKKRSITIWNNSCFISRLADSS